jgi:hypothetical protein
METEGARRRLALAAGGIGIATGAVVLLLDAFAVRRRLLAFPSGDGSRVS